MLVSRKMHEAICCAKRELARESMLAPLYLGEYFARVVELLYGIFRMTEKLSSGIEILHNEVNLMRSSLR